VSVEEKMHCYCQILAKMLQLVFDAIILCNLCQVVKTCAREKAKFL